MKRSLACSPVLSAALLVASLPAGAASFDPVVKPNTFPAAKPIEARTAAETLKATQLPPGYHLEPVLTEPEIKEPVAIAFDGDG
ncbi:MAG TPA: hypothetical protein VK961_25000, partial [Chthoniobacter sp.]|nr:hypothetical protein [Chthoniobacter sp.]